MHLNSVAQTLIIFLIFWVMRSLRRLRLILRDQFSHSVSSLRHTHASILINAEVYPLIISRRLGHSSIAITLDIYSHFFGKTVSGEDVAKMRLNSSRIFATSDPFSIMQLKIKYV